MILYAVLRPKTDRKGLTDVFTVGHYRVSNELILRWEGTRGTGGMDAGGAG